MQGRRVEIVLGLLVLAGLVWLVFFRGSDRSRPGPPPTDEGSSYTGRSRSVSASGAPSRRSKPRYAVIDLETSALRPSDGRIIEVGIVHLDEQGNVTDRWETLIDPGDGIAGRSDIHGIRAEWLAAAPTFDEVAGDIVQRLRGRVLVAHNARFDTEWLECEFNRIAKPFGDYRALCTMDVARGLGLPPKLSSCAGALGHRFHHHTAVEDAEAAGRIVVAGLQAGMTGHEGAVLSDGQLPHGLTATGKVMVRREAPEAVRPRPFLSASMLHADVVDQGHEPDDDVYLDVLERCLEDGVLDAAEQVELVGLASDLGLTHERALQLHGELVDALVEAALDDGTITVDERHEIEQAAAWLDVDLNDWQARVAAAKQRIQDARARFREEMVGRTVAFVGRGGHPKDVRDALASAHGITPRTRLTKDTDVVAIGSVDTANKSTQGAADKGIPVMLEHALWTKLGATAPATPHRRAPTAKEASEEPVGFELAERTLPGVTSGAFERRQVHEWADAIRQLRREGRTREAERVLVGCIQATELEALGEGYGVAPFYYEQLAILYSKAKRAEDELAVLERYDAAPKAPGAAPAQLAERLVKARQKVNKTNG